MDNLITRIKRQAQMERLGTAVVPRPNIFQVVDGDDRSLTLPTQETVLVSMARKVAE